jgi:16S rRNA (uracil1498-N3)-methyltransferase
MSLPHFFIDEILEGVAGTSVSLRLNAEAISHMRTLRLRAGEHMVVVDRPGHGWELELCSVPQRHSTVAEGVLLVERSEKRTVDLTLAQGVSASERMDQTVRQVTELGVARVIPLRSERSQSRLEGKARQTKLERWWRIAQSAAEQSGQLLLPRIEEPLDLAATLALVKDSDVLLFFWEEPGGCSLTDALESYAFLRRDACRCPRVTLFVGPEGGFSPREAALIKEAGARTITLGKTILRTETAAVVACALALFHLGALGAR